MSKLYEKLVRPAMFRLDAETAHEIGMRALRLGLVGGVGDIRHESVEIERFGLKFTNPLGVAAGFDKNGLVVNQLAALGFGFVEVGTVTLLPQKGNEKPRLFRLPEDQALINRLGFNNDGAKVVAERLRRLQRNCIVGVNIGKNKDVPNEEAAENYLASFDLVYDVADYIAVNISSPNTPNLRDLQRGENLEELVKALVERNKVLSSGFSPLASADAPRKNGTQNRKPILVKIAPDLTEGEIEQIVDVCMRLGVDGLIATNTTVVRDGLLTPDADKAGGLSGHPLTERSNQVIASVFRHSKGQLPIIGVGGIFSAEDGFKKIASGASLLQAYTGFIYKGPGFAVEVNRGIRRLLDEGGFETFEDAVGSGA